ncbi:MAG: helix-turn-helix domain-containing protein [Patescibacteria group bacterium]|nr:helix-turn-helix domain-containing protein [Patescibacteria group bacterium]
MKTVGEFLKEARRGKGDSIDQISKKTKIRLAFLKAIEENNFEILPSQASAKGFIKNYADYLEVSSVKALAIFNRDFRKGKQIEIVPQRAKELSGKFSWNPKTFGFLVSAFLFLLLLIFLVFKLFSLTSAPYG